MNYNKQLFIFLLPHVIGFLPRCYRISSLFALRSIQYQTPTKFSTKLKRSEEYSIGASDSFSAVAQPGNTKSPHNTRSCLKLLSEGNENKQFGAMPLAECFMNSLKSNDIISPTAIQKFAGALIFKGESVILQGETGGGKTLAFLLPLIQRLHQSPGGFLKAPACSVVIIVPTRELAIQTMREIVMLLPGADVGSKNIMRGRPLVQHLGTSIIRKKNKEKLKRLRMFDQNAEEEEKILAPIIVGTAKHLATVLLSKHPKSLDDEPLPDLRGQTKGMLKANYRVDMDEAYAEKKRGQPRVDFVSKFKVRHVVLDEVDRLYSLVRKHAPVEIKMARRRHPRPIELLMNAFVASNPQIQFVSCSATIGRPLKRALSSQIGLRRALSFITDSPEQLAIERKQRLLNRINISEELPIVEVSPRVRVVPPNTIAHSFVVCKKGLLKSKLDALLTELASDQPSSPLVFIPQDHSLETVKIFLQRAGFQHAMMLHHVIERPDILELYRTLKLQKKGAPTDRDATMRKGPILPILIASEASARGLHFDGIDVVYLLARPPSGDDYLHMAGRTGRNGLPGEVVSIFTSQELRCLRMWGDRMRFNITEKVSVAD